VNARTYLIFGTTALAIICATILAALRVVDANRVLDLLVAAGGAFGGGVLGARSSVSAGLTLRPPPKV
jgi:hypothetical protein